MLQELVNVMCNFIFKKNGKQLLWKKTIYTGVVRAAKQTENFFILGDLQHSTLLDMDSPTKKCPSVCKYWMPIRIVDVKESAVRPAFPLSADPLIQYSASKAAGVGFQDSVHSSPEERIRQRPWWSEGICNTTQGGQGREQAGVGTIWRWCFSSPAYCVFTLLAPGCATSD